MPILPIPSAAADREHEQARRHPERETLELATAGAAQVLGRDHGATKALARASTTMDKVDLWHARLAVKMLRRDQREPIAVAGEWLRRRAFLFPQPWHAVPMRTLTIALCLLAAPALAKRHSHGSKTS